MQTPKTTEEATTLTPEEIRKWNDLTCNGLTDLGFEPYTYQRGIDEGLTPEEAREAARESRRELRAEIKKFLAAQK